MSNVPPFQPPHPAASPGYGPAPASGPPLPPWQTQPTSLTPEPAPEKSKMPRVIGGIAVLVVVAVVVVVLVIAFGGSDSTGGTTVSGKAAHDGLRAVLADSTFDEDGNDDLRVCPLGNLDDLYDAVASVITIDHVVAEGTDERSAREEGDLPGFVSCQRYAPDETKVGAGATSVFFQAVLEPPRDYEGYITDFAGDVTEITFDDPVDYKGGTVYMFCADANEDSGFTGCDADWVDTKAKVALNVFLGGSDATPEDTLEALHAALPIMSANLAELAGNQS